MKYIGDFVVLILGGVFVAFAFTLLGAAAVWLLRFLTGTC